MLRTVALAGLPLLASCQHQPPAPAPPEGRADSLAAFTAQIDAIRTRLHIPGLSAISPASASPGTTACGPTPPRS